MYQLFPELRSDNANQYGAVVSARALRICQVLEGRGGPVSMRRLQDILIEEGEEWALDQAGYMAVWSVANQLRKAGILTAAKGGVELADPEKLTILFAASVANLIRETIPELAGLGELRHELMGQIQTHLQKVGVFQSRKRAKTVGQTA